MKKIFLLIVCSLFVSSSAYGLSCAGFPSFDDLLEDANIAFVGTVTNGNFFENTTGAEYCSQLGSDLDAGTYEFWFDVEEVMQGTVGSTAILTRNVTDLNCTRGGACNEMLQGETYVVLTQDGETLADGLCSPCPYMLLEDYEQSQNPLPEPEMCICTMQYDPVCGIDGKTYGNACGAGCQQVEIAYPGECQFGVPGGCERGYSGQVCGVDAITYDDICDLEDTGIAKAYDGACVANPGPDMFAEAPGFCTSWYDGCNECGIRNGLLGVCTERACFTMNRAKCTAFEFMYLSAIHERIIDNVIGDRLDTASQDDADIVIAKVQAKIDEINYTLSVSSFMQGSDALKAIQFMLEVLWKIDSAL